MAKFKIHKLTAQIEPTETVEYGNNYFDGVHDYIKSQIGKYDTLVTVCHAGDFQYMGAHKMRLVVAYVENKVDNYSLYYVVDTEFETYELSSLG